MPKMTSKQAERAARKLPPQAREAFLALMAMHHEQIAAGLSKYRRWESPLQYLTTGGEKAVSELWDYIHEQGRCPCVCVPCWHRWGMESRCTS